MQAKFDEQLKSYMTIWNVFELQTIQLDKKRTPLSSLTQTLRYFQIKRRLNKLCRLLCNDPEITLTTHQGMVRLISLWLNVEADAMDQTVSGDYVKSTETFIKRVRTYWPDMDDSSIFQALRNVWIMNAIQMMAGQPFELTDAMFAYSMLYPLTDNLMDDPNIDSSSKKVFVERFGDRLLGIPVEAKDHHESDVFEMIRLIEGQYSRTDYPEVYESLLLIHDAQLNSLRQHGEKLSLEELTYLTFRKGASSVIADGYLVLGKLSEAQLDFLMGYGIVLQLADDLQDMTEDAMHMHKTLFSDASTFEERYERVMKLIYLSQLTLEKMVTPDPLFSKRLGSLLGSSMTLLIGDAIYEQRKFFSKQIVKQIESNQVVRLAQHAKLKKLGGRWVVRLKSSAFVRRFDSL